MEDEEVGSSPARTNEAVSRNGIGGDGSCSAASMMDAFLSLARGVVTKEREPLGAFDFLRLPVFIIF